MSKSEREILHEAIKVYGPDQQIKKAVEEMGELTVALMKWDGANKKIDNVVEEMADVRIMLDQLEIILGQCGVKEDMHALYRELKTKRLDQRIAAQRTTQAGIGGE